MCSANDSGPALRPDGWTGASDILAPVQDYCRPQLTSSYKPGKDYTTKYIQYLMRYIFVREITSSKFTVGKIYGVNHF